MIPRAPLGLCIAALLGCPADDATPSSDTGSSSSAGDDSTSLPPPADGSTTSTVTSDGSGSSGDATGSTGASAVCGDDEVTGDEQCDDGNVDNGDDCYSNCTVPYELAWELSLDVGGLDDFAFEAITDAAGNLYLAGSTTVAPGDPDMWIQQVTPEGRAGWSYIAAGPAMDFDQFRSLVWLDGDLLATGGTTTATGYDAIVQRIDPTDQSLVWSATFDGPSDVADDEVIVDLAVTADGNIVVVGNVGATDEGVDAWVALLDDTGALQWEATYAGAAGMSDIAQGVVVADDGTIHVVGRENGAGADTGFHATYDPSGTELAIEPLSFVASDIAMDAATGAFVVAGFGGGAGVSGCNVRYYDATFAEQWVVGSSSTPAGACFGVSVGPDGDVYTAGQAIVAGQQGNYWVGRIRADGELLWHDSHNDRLDLNDSASYLLADDTGAAISVGFEFVSGEGTNLFMRKYTQGPTPPPK